MRSATREWYRVAVKGLLIPAKNPPPSWTMEEVFPWTGRSPLITLPPKAVQMAWWPRQTPRVGILLERVARAVRQRPDS